MLHWTVDAGRRLRASKTAALGLALLVGLTAFVAAAGPRLFDRVSKESVNAEVAAVPQVDRTVTLSTTDRGEDQEPPYPDLVSIDAAGAAFLADLPPALSAVLQPAVSVEETGSYRAIGGTAVTAEMRMRTMTDIFDHVRLVDGRAPTDAVDSIPDPLRSGVPNALPIPRLEAAISKIAADKLGLAVGATVTMGVDAQLDPLSGGGSMAARIVGIFEPADPSDPYWVDDQRVLGYTIREFSSNVVFVQSTMLLAPTSYETLATGRVNRSGTSGGLPISPPALRISWRYAARPGAITPDNLDPLISALRRVQARYPATASDPKAIVMQTNLLRRLVALEGPWAAAGALLSVAAAGAACVALACLALVVALTGEQRRRILLIQRERGASVVQTLAGALLEGAIVVIPAGLLGLSLAGALLPDEDPQLSIVAGSVVIVAGVLLYLGAVLPAALGPPRLPVRARGVVRAVRGRRLVLEGVIVGIAIAAAYALRQRGLSSGGAAASGASGVVEPTSVAGGGRTDPLLAAAPVLVGLAAAIVAVRLVPFPLAGLSWLTARTRGFAAVLATRRAARDSGAARVLLIILAIATVAGFASATVVEMNGTAVLQSWQEVGAPYRIDASRDQLGGAGRFPEGFDPQSLPGVTGAISANLAPVALSTGGQRVLAALDLAAYQQLLAGSPVALSLPPELLAPTAAGGAEAGTTAAPLPALVSSGSSGPFAAPKVGATFQISFASKALAFRTVALVDSFPGIPAGQPFVVASWPQIDAAAPNRLIGGTTVFAAAPPAAAAAIGEAVKSAAPQAVVSDRAARAAELAGQGVVEIVALGVATLAAIGLGYAALAVMAAFVLTASARADEAAHLATLGLSNRQSSWMLVIEFGPPVALAVLAGVSLGLGLFAFLAPGLGLTTIVGALQAAPPGLDPIQLGLLAALVAAILAVGVGLGGAAQRRGAQAAVRRGLR